MIEFTTFMMNTEVMHATLVLICMPFHTVPLIFFSYG